MQDQDFQQTQFFQTVDLDQIVPSSSQPRKPESFDQSTLLELAHSIQSVGLLQPPLVRPIKEGLFEIVAGERRVRAAKMAGLSKIPVVIQKQDDLKKSLAALIENLQRENLNPIDTALALRELSEDFGLTHQKLADLLGLNRTSLSNQIRLLNLAPMMQKALKKQLITAGHAKALLAIENLEKREALFHRILKHHLSVRETEKWVQQIKQVKASKDKFRSKPSILLKQIQEALQEKAGTKVSFQGDEKRGSLTFHYYSLTDLNRLLNAIGYTD